MMLYQSHAILDNEYSTYKQTYNITEDEADEDMIARKGVNLAEKIFAQENSQEDDNESDHDTLIQTNTLAAHLQSARRPGNMILRVYKLKNPFQKHQTVRENIELVESMKLDGGSHNNPNYRNLYQLLTVKDSENKAKHGMMSHVPGMHSFYIP